MRKQLMTTLVMAAVIFISTGSTQAGMIGHVSAVPIGPALKYSSSGDADAAGDGRAQVQPKEGMNSSGYQGREAVETGKLPERKGFESNGMPVVELGGTVYRIGIDTP
jgi:hypothetical protein